MPVYEFKCDECGEVFELLVGHEVDIEDLKCPKCGSMSMERLFSIFGIGGDAYDGNCGTGGGFSFG